MLSLCPRCKKPVRLVVTRIGTLSGRTCYEGYCQTCLEIVQVYVTFETVFQKISKLLGRDTVDGRAVEVP